MLLSSLLVGLRYKRDGREWAIHDGAFGCIGKKVNGSQDEVLMRVDMTVDQFIEFAQEMTDDEFTHLAASRVLNNLR